MPHKWMKIKDAKKVVQRYDAYGEEAGLRVVKTQEEKDIGWYTWVCENCGFKHYKKNVPNSTQRVRVAFDRHGRLHLPDDGAADWMDHKLLRCEDILLYQIHEV
jgi:hypothetical protein